MHQRRNDLLSAIISCLILAAPLVAAESNFSVGGEIREKWEVYRNPGFGSEPPDSDGYALTRLLVHFDTHLPVARVFAELGSMTEVGRNGGARPTDRDNADLTQAFVEFPGEAGVESYGLRMGRQEIVLGSSRLVGARDGPNVRLSFEAVRGWVHTADWQIDAFVARPVATRQGVFDDRADVQRRLAGIYAVSPKGFMRYGSADFYFFDFRNSNARYERGRGNEDRQMVGVRAWGGAAGLDWNWELGGQSGKFDGAPIKAWALASETGYTWKDASMHPRAVFRFNAISGDRHGSSLGTFNAFFPSPFFFGETKIIGPANVYDIVGSLELALRRNVTFDFVAGAFWRFSDRDGLYTYSGSLLRRSSGSDSRYIGDQASARLDWKVTASLSLTAAVAAFDPGPFLSDTGGKGMRYFSLSSTYRFSNT